MFFEFSGHLTPTTIHVIFGVVCFVFFYLVLRRLKHAAIISWLLIFLMQFINECVDFYFQIHLSRDINVRGIIKDFVATLFLPGLAVLFLAPNILRIIGMRKPGKGETTHKK